ncbi:hypothetical protein P7C71_g3925, partial [Lecanoromycetidae sp. Uapishka_2]
MAKRKVIEDSDDEDNDSLSPERKSTRTDLDDGSIVEDKRSAAAEDQHQSAEQSTASTDSEGGPGERNLYRLASSGAKKKQKAIDNVGQKHSTLAMSSGDTELIGTGERYIPNPAESNAEIWAPMPPPAAKPISFQQTQPKEIGTLPKGDSTPLTWTPASLKSLDETRSFKMTHSDDRVPTPTMSSKGRSDGGQDPFHDSTEGPLKRPRLHIDTEPADREEAGLIDPSSSASIISPSKTITVTKSASSFEPSFVGGDLGGRELESLERLHPGSGIINPIVLLPQLPQHDEGQDELSLFISNPETESEFSTKNPMRKEVNEPVSNELGSDDAEIGLPKDQYKPRPSKSRSGCGNEESAGSTSPSKAPEAIVKRNRKFQRRKTTAFHELVPKEEDDEDEEEFVVVNQPALEIPKRRSRKILAESEEEDPDATDAMDERRSGREMAPQLPAKPQQAKKQRGRPKKAVNEPNQDEVAAALPDAPNHGDEELEMDVNVDTRKGLALDDKSTNLKQANVAVEDSVASAKAKKGRKKSKPCETPATISEGIAPESDNELATTQENQDPHRKVLDDKDPNSAQSKPVEKNAASPPLPKSAPLPPETPRKAASVTPKGPDKHSPISSGKVAYRVGLSKRARIEPLLRIVRKC